MQSTRKVMRVIGGFLARSRSTATNTAAAADSEYEKFKRLSGQWWDLNGPCSALHAMNSVRVPWVVEGVNNTSNPEKLKWGRGLEGRTLLDIGCGGGLLSEPLARLGAKVTGIDMVGEGIEAAKLHSQLDPTVFENVNYKVDKMENHVTERKYDVIVASEVVEHVDDLFNFVKACSERVQDNGHIFITTINRTWQSRLLAINVGEYVLNIIPRGTHEWDKFIKPSELHEVLELCNFRVLSTQGMAYAPFVNKWYWCSSTAVSYAVHAVKNSA